jgi:hypothetical protein
LNYWQNLLVCQEVIYRCFYDGVSSQPNGFYKNLPSEQYLAADHINNSALKLINTPFLHYKESQALPEEETTAMVMSSAVHTTVLEPSIRSSE